MIPFGRLVFAVVFSVLHPGVLEARVPSIEELLDEIEDSRVILTARFTEVTRTLRERWESGETESLEGALGSYLQTLNEHLAAFEALVDSSGPAKDLRLRFIALLQWKRAELPGRIKAASAATEGQLPGSAQGRAAIANIMEPFVSEERKRMKELNEVGRKAILHQEAVSAGKGESRSGVPSPGTLLALLSVSTVGMAVAMRILLKRSRGQHPADGTS